jgi:hypothetical protein
MPANFSLPGEEKYRPAAFPVFRELSLIADEDEMRAGMLLQHNTFYIGGEARPFCWIQLPLSEGLTNPAYSAVFISLMREAMAQYAFLGSLGVGSMQEPWARLLVQLGWQHQFVPFVFYPVHAAKVLSGLRYLHRRPVFRICGRLAGWSGCASALEAALWLRRTLPRLNRSYTVACVPAFDEWADDVFRKNQLKYGATPRRDASTLNIIFPPEDTRYLRLRVRKSGSQEDLGWILLVNARMQDNKYFGDLHVGTLVTGFCDPLDAPLLVHAGLTELAELGVDLVVANWSHHLWLRACRQLGFLPGPSNYIFFSSPGGKPLLEPACPLGEIHLSRGDCDSPASLMPSRSAT